MDLPAKTDNHGVVVVTGVESEEVEEVNDAYKDILEEIGKRTITFKVLRSSIPRLYICKIR